MSDTSETFLRDHPKLTRTLSSTSNKLKNKYTKYKPTINKYLSHFQNFFQNKYVKAVLYIILILYASVIAPKLPNWLIPYLEYSIVKILIVFIIGLLATQDPIAAIIATIGVTITYLFISENKVTNYIKNIFDNDEDDKKKEKFVQSNQPIQSNQSTMNIEHFNNINENENTTHNVEYFDILDNNNNYISHIEEHFDLLNTNTNTKKDEQNTENINIIAYDNQNYANNANINY